MVKTGTPARRLLTAAGVQGRAVAKALGLSEPAVSLKLSGRRPFRPEELAAIRDILNEPEHLKRLGRRRLLTLDDLVGTRRAA